MSFTARDVVNTVSRIACVTLVSAETVKPGVVRVRVVGGDVDAIRQVIETMRPLGARVVIEHRTNADAAPTEVFL